MNFRDVSLARSWQIIAGVIAITVLALTCGKKSNPISSGGGTPQPQPDGVLLSGNQNANAFDAITVLPPSPASDADIQDDGLMLTRLEAVIAPLASVVTVNNSLQSHNLRIICMLPNSPLVTLKAPKMSSRSSVDSLMAALLSDSAFAFVFPSYEMRSEPDSATAVSQPASKIAPGGSANNEIEHLKALNMLAAWNVKDLISSSTRVRVLVPDEYYQTTPHPELPSQSFIPGGNVTTTIRRGEATGNHGFHVCGIIGATLDTTGATGVHPSAGQNLSILSMPIGGFSSTDALAGTAVQIGQRLPTGMFVLNTSLGYNDPGFVRMTKLKRAIAMISWRAWVAKSQDRFLHAAAAGNDGTASDDSRLASWNSAWNSAARFASAKDMLSGVSLSANDSASLDQIVSKILAIVPEAAQQLRNVIIVGNNQGDGTEDPTSAKNPDVRCVGQLVYSTCVHADPGFPAGLAQVAREQMAGIPGPRWRHLKWRVWQPICGR